LPGRIAFDRPFSYQFLKKRYFHSAPVFSIRSGRVISLWQVAFDFIRSNSTSEMLPGS